MHSIAHALSRIGLDDIEEGRFSPEDFRAILTELQRIAAETQGAESDLSEYLDEASGYIYAEDWPTYDERCGYCDGSGEGRYDGTRCMNCKGKGVLKLSYAEAA